LNFAPDHLDIHADLAAYEEAKSRIWDGVDGPADAVADQILREADREFEQGGGVGVGPRGDAIVVGIDNAGLPEAGGKQAAAGPSIQFGHIFLVEAQAVQRKVQILGDGRVGLPVEGDLQRLARGDGGMMQRVAQQMDGIAESISSLLKI